MSHHLCIRCAEKPISGLQDCPECALHKKGPNTEGPKKSRAELSQVFERTWFQGLPITTTERHLEVRLAWLAYLYEVGWTEAEFEADSIPMDDRDIKPHKSANRRSRNNNADDLDQPYTTLYWRPGRFI